jgi:hypothetical protein
MCHSFQLLLALLPWETTFSQWSPAVHLSITSCPSHQFSPDSNPRTRHTVMIWDTLDRKRNRANRVPLCRLQNKPHTTDTHFGHPILPATCNRNLLDFRTVLIFTGALCGGRKKWFTTSRSVEITCQESNSYNLIFNVKYESVKASNRILKNSSIFYVWILNAITDWGCLRT